MDAERITGNLPNRPAAVKHESRNPLHSSAGLQTDFLDNEVVSAADNPLRGWRWFGAELLYAELWPKCVLFNPVMVYFSGRRAGREEDLLGLAPWATLLLLHIAFMFFVASDGAEIMALAVLELILLPIMAAIVTGVMTGSHLRHAMRGMSLEEFLTTPITPLDLVQGFSVRPIAVQAAAHFGFLVLNAALVLMATWYHDGSPGFVAFVIMVVWSPVVWHLMRGTNELGGAFGVRAHLCIKDPHIAAMRMMLDILLYIVVCVGIAILMIPGLIAVIQLTMGLFCLLTPVLLVVLPLLIVRQTRAWAVSAMNFCHENPQEWWVNELNEEGRFVRERGLWTGWDMEGMRVD
ncbi:MAG: hypothetical protein PWP23_2427 [Candidatus Sumerlaeota bacterium]|nr:hypothetical protein [Candidatus Sumerlaeota bacterium]